MEISFDQQVLLIGDSQRKSVLLAGIYVRLDDPKVYDFILSVKSNTEDMEDTKDTQTGIWFKNKSANFLNSP
jgi:hypothetical protein